MSDATVRPVQVWLVEDNRLYRTSISRLIEQTPDLQCAIATDSCEGALAAIDNGMLPDIVLMDIGLPGIDGIEGTRRIKSLCPASRLIMLTVHEESDNVFEAICAGASGYLLKPSRGDEIVEAIRQVGDGAAPINAYIAAKMLDLFAKLSPPAPPPDDYGLTPREREVLQHLVDGLTMRQAAERLEISYHTVDAHIRNIYEKLHVRSRSRAVAKAVEENLV